MFAWSTTTVKHPAKIELLTDTNSCCKRSIGAIAAPSYVEGIWLTVGKPNLGIAATQTSCRNPSSDDEDDGDGDDDGGGDNDVMMMMVMMVVVMIMMMMMMMMMMMLMVMMMMMMMMMIFDWFGCNLLLAARRSVLYARKFKCTENVSLASQFQYRTKTVKHNPGCSQEQTCSWLQPGANLLLAAARSKLLLQNHLSYWVSDFTRHGPQILFFPLAAPT